MTRPEGIGKQDFQDPTNAWQTDNGYWMIIVGAIHQQFRQGMSLLYRSKDLRHWEPLDHVLHTLNGTGMWEMQDFFNVDYETSAPSSKWVLKVGLIDEWHDYYTIGTYDKVAQQFIPDFLELDCGVGQHGHHENHSHQHPAASSSDYITPHMITHDNCKKKNPHKKHHNNEGDGTRCMQNSTYILPDLQEEILSI